MSGQPAPRTARGVFEKIIGSPPYELEIERYPNDDKQDWPGNYKDVNVQLAWVMFGQGLILGQAAGKKAAAGIAADLAASVVARMGEIDAEAEVAITGLMS